MKIMKTKERIRKIADSRWARTLALAAIFLIRSFVFIIFMCLAGMPFPVSGALQVPLPYSLFSRGTGHHSVHTEFSGLLKSDDMEHARNLSLQHKGAVRERAALFVSVTTGNDTGRKGKGLKTQTLANRELQGKVGKRFLSDGKVRPQAVSEKIILAALRYFSRKPCLSGSICRWALVVQRAAKARVFTVKN